MLEKMFTDNPIAFLMLIASIVGTGYLVVYRLDRLEANNALVSVQINDFGNELDEFEDNMREDVDDLEDDMTRQLTELTLTMTTELGETNTRVAVLEQVRKNNKG
ncbi:hypothetical protein LZS85_15530 [Aliivibrio fischeri]|uniref:hypothetical protein n=1 Tax=Aliivibrio fischeri TaxID=668 RepID=UPI001F261A74|nr:hypothetical protein [Aliivibrio fischeri]MCE7567534.1 hypothetical protein [Aliivibrio fischeri]